MELDFSDEAYLAEAQRVLVWLKSWDVEDKVKDWHIGNQEEVIEKWEERISLQDILTNHNIQNDPDAAKEYAEKTRVELARRTAQPGCDSLLMFRNVKGYEGNDAAEIKKELDVVHTLLYDYKFKEAIAWLTRGREEGTVGDAGVTQKFSEGIELMRELTALKKRYAAAIKTVVPATLEENAASNTTDTA